MQLNGSDVAVAGHFNLAQRLDVLALEYNMTLATVTRLFRSWTKQYGKNYTSGEESARHHILSACMRGSCSSTDSPRL